MVQKRGSPHVHGFMWISDAPKYISGDINSTNTVCDFIDKYITSENDVELAKYQIHHHTHSCRRRLLKKFKDVGAARKKSKYILAAGESCRFQIPYPPMRTTRVLEPLPRGSKEDTKRHRENYEIIKRRLEDIRIESAKRNLLQRTNSCSRLDGTIKTTLTQSVTT